MYVINSIRKCKALGNTSCILLSIMKQRLFSVCSFAIMSLSNFIPLSPVRIRVFFFRMYTMGRMSLTLIHTIVYYKCNSNDCRDEDTSQRPGLYMMNHNGPYSLTSFLCTFHHKQCTSINFVIIPLSFNSRNYDFLWAI